MASRDSWVRPPAGDVPKVLMASAKLETERRRAQAAIAGKVAAASPRHVSKQRKSAERAPAAADRLLRGK